MLLGTSLWAGIFAAVAYATPIEKCPGYKVSNVVTSGTSLTADLSLAGEPCNTYGEDLKDLILHVEYQNGMVLSLFVLGWGLG